MIFRRSSRPMSWPGLNIRCHTGSILRPRATGIWPDSTGGRVGLLMIGSARESVRGEAMPPEVRWILSFELFIDYGAGDIQGSHGTIFIAADRAGNIVDRPWMQTFVRPDLTKHIPPLIPFTHPALLAFSVVHPPAERR